MAIPRKNSFGKKSSRKRAAARGLHAEKRVEGEAVDTHAPTHSIGGIDAVAAAGIGAAATEHGHLQNNYVAGAAPGATDDSGSGYSIGSVWVDITNDKAYICLDNTVDTAVWVETTAGAAGGETNTASSAGSGISLFYQKSGVDLEFNAIKSESNRLTIALDGATHDVELTVVEINIDHDALANFLAVEHVNWAAASAGTVHTSNIPHALADHNAFDAAGTAITSVGAPIADDDAARYQDVLHALAMGKSGVISAAADTADFHLVVPFKMDLSSMAVSYVAASTIAGTVQLRRTTADGTAAPSWANAFGSLAIGADEYGGTVGISGTALSGERLNFSTTGGGDGTGILVEVIGNQVK